tara:strand:+ start:175 stop:657 length:483 start_codon:yes stop_codon:yes gene_type:complete
MFTQTEESTEEFQKETNVKKETVPYINKYENTKSENSISINKLDLLLEKEKMSNKSEQWNKIDKTVKTQLLHSFAEKYGNDNKLPAKEIKNLKLFFSDCLNKGKLQKNKDVNYSRDNQQILSIPSLFFNNEKKNFTLRIMDNKRVSTLKSLTPKRTGNNN